MKDFRSFHKKQIKLNSYSEDYTVLFYFTFDYFISVVGC